MLNYQSVPTPAPPRLRVTSLIAWIFIALVAVGMPILTAVGARQAASPTTQPAGANWQLVMMGRHTLQTANYTADSKQKLVDDFEAQSPTPDGQVAGAILRGELLGRDAGTSRLHELGTDDAIDVLRLYEDRHATATSTSSFVARYPWFADLARVNGAPVEDPLRWRVYRDALNVFVAILLGGGSVLVLLLVGIVLLLLGVIFFATGTMSLKMPLPAGPSHTYVEAFAIYLALMVVGSVALELIGMGLKIDLPMSVRVAPLALATVVGLAWPLVRGARWDVLKRDIGLHTGRGLFAEIGFGIVGYIASLPILGLAVLITALLMHFSGGTSSHPLTEQIDSLSPVALLLIAAVFAPLTEETMFRGLLLTNLRGALSRTLSVVLGPLIVGLIFAAIHPQGWLGIPVLMSIGAAFSVLRLWRDSLVAPITAHAIHNGAVVTFLILITSM